MPRLAERQPTVELTAQRWISDRHGVLSLRSAALGRPAEVRILLPPGAEANARPAAPPPLLLLLHGADDSPAGWETGVGIVERCADLGAVVVMPEGGEVGFCTDWVNRERPVRGRIGSSWADRVAPAWERFHLEEVLPWVSERFGASGRRVVLGISMGGHGAISYAARHPGTFAAAASFSGVLDTLAQGLPSMIAASLMRHRQHRHALWGSPLLSRSLWRSHNPLDLADRLAGVALYLARGDGQPHPEDPEFGPGAAALERIVGRCTDAMALRLQQLEIPATVSHGAGGHDWPTWNRELDLAWPFLLRGLGLT
jgi:diacylglycerol O-acyltransferase/trehalose O-mycolyltransferase